MIDTQAIRSKILNLAMRGQLTEQLPEDGTAEELYQQIQAEKQAFVTAGKIKKEKPLPGITPEETPFDIPENWKWVRIADISSITSGGTPSRGNSLFWNGNIPWVKISDISAKYVTETEEKITEAGLNNSSAKIFPKGTLLYTIFATIGTVGILNIDAATNQAIAGVTFLGKYNLDYLYYILVGLKDILVAKGKGMAQMNINQTILKNTPIPLPPLAEQQRIVEKIGQVFSVLDTIDALQARHADNLAALKAKLIDAAIRGKLTEQLPQDGTAEELYQRIQAEKQALIKAGKIRKEKPLPEVTPKEAPFDIPANWKWVRLANIWSVINGDRGKNYPAKSTLSRNGIPFVSALNLDGGTVANDDRLLCLSESQYDKLGNGKLIQGDIVVCIRGSLGKHGRYPFEKGAIASSLAIMRLPINEPLLDDYLMTYLDAPLFFDEILKYNNGTAQPNLAAKNLEKFLIPLPPLAEQQRIVARLDEVLKIIEQ